MRTNRKTVGTERTHEGAQSVRTNAEVQLRRTVMSCMLFEKTFYEDGQSVAQRIKTLVGEVSLDVAAQAAVDAREKFKLRHVPLLIVREIMRHHNGRKVGDVIARVIQRPDEAGELLALYRADGGKGEPAQLKLGLSRAIKTFSEYQLAKWSRDGAFKLRDVLRLAHPRPRDDEQSALFNRVVAGELATPDTWEVALSGGTDKKETFERLITERKLGALALLRNLRGMIAAGVDTDIIRDGLDNMRAERVLPFRFISAARHAPQIEDAIEKVMFRCLAAVPKLGGKTALLIDHSRSMRSTISDKSDISRFDAAAAVAMILREVCEQVRIFTFSDSCIEVPPRHGFAMIDAVKAVINPVSTLLGKAVQHVYREFPECSRIIVITDEQSADRPPQPRGTGYIINVAAYQNGIGYGPWITINGWSEAIIDYIREHEANK